MKVIDFIVAEDVRLELGNKHSVMGIFTESISLTVPSSIKWPIGFRLASFIRFEFDDKDPKDFKFVYRIKWGGEDIARFDGEATRTPESSIVTLPFVGEVVPLKGPGVFGFSIEILSGSKVVYSGELRNLQVLVSQAK